jgi:hypothetical protein
MDAARPLHREQFNRLDAFGLAACEHAIEIIDHKVEHVILVGGREIVSVSLEWAEHRRRAWLCRRRVRSEYHTAPIGERKPKDARVSAFRFHKVINEPDFLPLFFLRNLAETVKFLSRHKGHLRTTRDGRLLLDKTSALQAILFHVALWHVDLSQLARGVHNGWPQCDVGIVLWSLSIAARDWQSPERLTRLCTVSTRNVVEATAWDSASAAMEATILRPLWWFGLLDHREEDIPDSRFGQNRFYRKTLLFDRFLTFDVKLETPGALRH